MCSPLAFGGTWMKAVLGTHMLTGMNGSSGPAAWSVLEGCALTSYASGRIGKALLYDERSLGGDSDTRDALTDCRSGADAAGCGYSEMSRCV